MTDQVKALAVRLAAALGIDIDPEFFTDPVAWALVAKVEEAANAHRKLDAGTLHIFGELSIAMNFKPGADPKTFLAALEAQLGTSPFPESTIVQLVTYVRDQLYGDFGHQERARVELDAPPAGPWVPLKNLDFE